MKRLLTAAVGVPIAVAAMFLLPSWGFFLLVLAITMWCAWEYIALTEIHAPESPRWLVMLFVPPAAVAGSWILGPAGASGELVLLVGGLFFGVGLGILLLVSGSRPEHAVPALGVIGYGVGYFALPVVAIATLQRIDPWLVILLCAIVWLGDTAAFYIGTRFGRARLAPTISPNKSWEGAIASFVAAVGSAVVWSQWRTGSIETSFVVVAAATAVASQMGDLMESLLKRGAHVKDSGHVLPGHGGMLDRFDAMLFGAPVLLAGLWMIGWPGVSGS